MNTEWRRTGVLAPDWSVSKVANFAANFAASCAMSFSATFAVFAGTALLAGSAVAAPAALRLSGLPLPVSVTPIAADLRIDQQQFEIAAIRFDCSLQTILRHFEPGALHRTRATGPAPVRVQRLGKEWLISWWHASDLILLKLQSDSVRLDSRFTSGLLVVSRALGAPAAANQARFESVLSISGLIAAQVTPIRMLASREGDVEHLLVIARIASRPASAARLLTEHFTSIGFSRPAFPTVHTDHHQLLHFQKARLQVSAGIHGQGDESMLVIQASKMHGSALQTFQRESK
jgi:hypothetical protein